MRDIDEATPGALGGNGARRLPWPPTSPQRLAALHEIALCEGPAEDAFDRLARLAATVLDAPVALITLVGAEADLPKSVHAPPDWYPSGVQQSSDFWICQQVAREAEPLFIRDLRRHSMIGDPPAAVASPSRTCLGAPLRGADGEPLGSLCLMDDRPRCWSSRAVQILADIAASVVTEIELRVDVIERQRTEAALRESEARFRTMFEEAALGIGIGGPDGRLLECNEAAARMLGYTREELLVADPVKRTHPDDLPVELALFQEMVEGKRDHYHLEKRYIRKDGSLMWGSFTMSLARDRDGSPLLMVGLIEDISERKRAEELAHQVRVLEGLLPICSFCKKIRNEGGDWEGLEEYISARSEAAFTHGVCPHCAHGHYGLIV